MQLPSVEYGQALQFRSPWASEMAAEHMQPGSVSCLLRFCSCSTASCPSRRGGWALLQKGMRAPRNATVQGIHLWSPIQPLEPCLALRCIWTDDLGQG